MTVYELSNHVSIISVCVPFVTGLILFKKIDANSRVLVLLLFFATLAQLSTYSNRSEEFYNLYTVLDPLFWGYIFFRNSRNKWIRSFIVVTACLQPIVSLSRFDKVGLSDQFYSQLVCINNLLLLLWVVSFFYERYYTDHIYSLEREPLFWFCLGILFYAPGSYFYFAFQENLAVETSAKITAMHDLLNTAQYLIFAFGIYINLKRNVRYQNAFS